MVRVKWDRKLWLWEEKKTVDSLFLGISQEKLWNRLDRLGDHVCNAQRSLKDKLVTSGFLLIKVHNLDPFARLVAMAVFPLHKPETEYFFYLAHRKIFSVSKIIYSFSVRKKWLCSKNISWDFSVTQNYRKLFYSNNIENWFSVMTNEILGSNFLYIKITLIFLC
jgi:hypothetical protein